MDDSRTEGAPPALAAPRIARPGRTILVVGAGFAGATHARVLAEAGWDVEVIDRRPHVAGNAHDATDANGVRVHRYGPHLFHTKNEPIVRWLARFGELVPYEHRVQAILPSGACAPMPINRATINEVFGVALESADDVRTFLRREALPIAEPANAAEHLASTIGTRLTDLFFRPYTRKMWALDLEDMAASVVKRIPLRFDDEDRYFPDDDFQLMPRDGYTRLFERMLDHPRIRVRLGTAFDRTMRRGMAHCFNSMPIDEYFGDAFGALPYRSIRFHHRTEAADAGRGTAATLNFTDTGKLTRETHWARLPGHAGHGGATTVTAEEPCADHENEMERYYPVKRSDGRYDDAYRRYRALADTDPDQTFIGRCGTYQYLDMHQVIAQSLAGARKWLERATAGAA